MFTTSAAPLASVVVPHPFLFAHRYPRSVLHSERAVVDISRRAALAQPTLNRLLLNTYFPFIPY